MNIFAQVNFLKADRPFVHFWSECVGAGRANEGLRASWQQQLKLAVDTCGFRYIRFHGLFHDDMFVYRKFKEGEVYNWQYIDDLFDFLLSIGIRPFVELGFCPGDMASEKNTVMWWNGHGSPPSDYGKWVELIERFVRHCIARYGLDEVKRWYFEVWNEPNLSPFFRGTKSQYFELYKVTAQAIKRVNVDLRVGGPATSNFVPDERFDGEKEDNSKQKVHEVEDLESLEWHAVWMEQFIDFCAKEHLPVDFVSTHPYPTDFSLDGHGVFKGRSRSVDSTRMDCAWVKKFISSSPYPDAEIHLTEWSSSPSPRDYTHDFLQAATFIVKANIESSGTVDSLSYWTFTDVFEEGGAGDTVFHGGFGMINYQGIVKPAYHAYRMLHELGDIQIQRGDGYVVTRNSKDGSIAALAYHYPIEVRTSPTMSNNNRDAAERDFAAGTKQDLVITFEGLTPGNSILIETLDENHGWVLRTWEAMGAPEPPTREQTQILKEAALKTKKEFAIVGSDGKFVYKNDILPWSVVLVKELR